MSKRTLGTLADLAKILEQAADPTSAVREDRQIVKPKAASKKVESLRTTKAIDPKRKAWYERRLREQASAPVLEPTETPVEPLIQPEKIRAIVPKVGGTLLKALAEAKNPKPSEGAKRPEVWRRKPGDPLF
jgi:hypothetical protein